MKTILSFASLFTSFGTLLCCALPALLVALGAGAALAGVVSTVPSLVWLSAHKNWIFSFGALLILLSLAAHLYSTQKVQCPTDDLQKNCQTTKQASSTLLWFSVGMYLVGFVFTFVLPLFDDAF